MPVPAGAYPLQPNSHGQPSLTRESMGLSQDGLYKFEPPARMGEARRPIDFLSPGSTQHAFVLDYLLKRLNWSEQKMSQFYPRWQAGEMRLQAYVTLPKYEELLRTMREEGRAQAPDEIVVPYAWATQQTIVTYLLHTFGGRSPIFQVGAYRAEQVQRAKNMETLLQYNCDHISYIYHLYNYFSNGEAYGLAVQRNSWTRVEREKTITRPPDPQVAQMMSLMGRNAQPIRSQEKTVCFEGNSVSVINPFMFFPDPRVPMVEVADKGEFVFWRDYQGRHSLLRAEADGALKWVKYATDRSAVNGMMGNAFGSDSLAGLRALGDSLTSGGNRDYSIAPNIQVDQGSVEIIPRELGLGDSDRPEKWLFTILNKSQIVQAERVQLNHGQHPVSVSEPNAFGHSFGQLSTVDLMAPMQDLMSWLINSHMYNVRASLNNLLVVDPQRVEIDDILNPLPGGIIRLKSTPWAQADARMAVNQLPIQDITRAHLQDFQLVNRLGNDLTGASDNIRGIQDSGGRKTATEVRTSFEAGGSRLASRAMLYSAMGLSRGSQQWASNYQQFLSEGFEARVLGADGVANSVRITPQEIEGDFYFPIHDGTLPLDKMAAVEQWKEIWMAISQDPTGRMQQEYNAPKIFRFMAQLGGAQNIDEFRNQPGMGGQMPPPVPGQVPGAQPGAQQTAVSPEAIAQQSQAGNLVPLSELQGIMPR